MSDRAVFLRERYRASVWAGKPDGQPAANCEDLMNEMAAAPFMEQTPDLFSQEMFFLYNHSALREYLAGRCTSPYYRHYAYDQLWKSRPASSPYIDRLIQLYPALTLELIEALARHRSRGECVLPLPAELKSGWKCASGTGENLFPEGVGKYDCAIVTPRLGVGGGEKVVRELARAIERITQKPALIIVADTEHEGGKNVLALSSLMLADTPFLLSPIPVRANALRNVLVYLGIKRLFSVNSFIANYAIQRGRFAGSGISIACAMFSVPVLASGEIGGFLRDVDWLAPNVDAFFTDNHAMAHVLRDKFFCDNLHVLPIPERPHDLIQTTGDRILWASRIDEEKKPELLRGIASQMPERIFEIWGAPVLTNDRYLESILELPNVCYRGPFTSFEEIDLRHAGCYLYTSRYDGKPNILVEAMSRGLPCIATAVGGIPELLREGRGVLVPPEAPAEAYVSAMRRVFEKDGEAIGPAGREYVRAVHTQKNFHAAVEKLLHALSIPGSA
jgi:glycosyltransferase involved in cell wall biosynthesis